MISSYLEAKDIEGINVAIDITNTLIIMPSNLKDEQVYEVILTTSFG